MNTRWVIRCFLAVALSTVAGGGPTAAFAQAPIKIGLVQGFTGPLEVYAKQAKRGFDLGLEYATSGKKELLGRKIEIIEEDDQLKPDVAKQKVTTLYADDKVDLVVGTTTSSAAALAVLPVAAEFKKVLIVEPAVADMEGLEFQTPKGKMVFRKEDHQALQSMYAFKMVSRPDVAWLVPTLVRELSPQETAPAITNKR